MTIPKNKKHNCKPYITWNRNRIYHIGKHAFWRNLLEILKYNVKKILGVIK